MRVNEKAWVTSFSFQSPTRSTGWKQIPNDFPLYYRGFRRVLTERFPYRLFFRIESGAVIVFRILYAARNHPGQLI